MDPLKYIFEKPSLSGKICRWQMQLSEYDIIYTSQKAIKGSVIADHRAEQAFDEYTPLKFEFPDEDILVISNESEKYNQVRGGLWTLYFDGPSNMLGHGIGVVLISPDGKHLPLTAKLCFDCTNNIAEYEACAFGVRLAIQEGIKKL